MSDPGRAVPAVRGQPDHHRVVVAPHGQRRLQPAASRLDGETLLLVRVEDRSGLSRLGVARSRDGFTDWRIEWTRDLAGPRPHAERWGVEDARITRTGDEHLIVYTGYSTDGPLVCLAITRDFRAFERRGVIKSPEDKDAALFPRRSADAGR